MLGARVSHGTNYEWRPSDPCVVRTKFSIYLFTSYLQIYPKEASLNQAALKRNH